MSLSPELELVNGKERGGFGAYDGVRGKHKMVEETARREGMRREFYHCRDDGEAKVKREDDGGEEG